MPQTDPATQKQMQFLWNLIQGANEMQLMPQLPPQLQTEQSVTQTMQAGMTRQNCSAFIEDLIFRVGAVPPGSRVDTNGQVKYASAAQVNLYRTLAQEVAQGGDQQWVQYDMQGRYSWTVSKWISKLKDIKERSTQQAQPQWGQQPQPQQQQWQQPQPQQQPAQAQPQWGQQPQAVPQQAFQPQAQPPAQGVPQQQWPQPQQQPPAQQAPPQAQAAPMFDQYGNSIPQGDAGNLPFS